jgi:hypothetical protein
VEIRILRAKSSALAISSRAVSRGGTGHDYWEKFDKGTQADIERLGAQLHRLLFMPALRQSIKTLDVPLAGFGYGSHVLPFVFDLVSRANRLGIVDSTRKKTANEELADDQDGKETLSYLRRARKMVRLICSNDPCSLGLHPSLYFYTPDGIFQPAALFNAADWFVELESRGKLNDFLDVRGAFEALILDHPVVVRRPTHTLGSGARTRARSVSLYTRVLDLLSEGKAASRVWDIIVEEPDFLFEAR